MGDSLFTTLTDLSPSANLLIWHTFNLILEVFECAFCFVRHFNYIARGGCAVELRCSN